LGSSFLVNISDTGDYEQSQLNDKMNVRISLIKVQGDLKGISATLYLQRLTRDSEIDIFQRD